MFEAISNLSPELYTTFIVFNKSGCSSSNSSQLWLSHALSHNILHLDRQEMFYAEGSHSKKDLFVPKMYFILLAQWKLFSCEGTLHRKAFEDEII